METKKNTPPKTDKPPAKTPPMPSIQDQLFNLGNVFNQFVQKVNKMEIDVSKANANFEVMNNRLDVIKATIELTEKRMDFNEKKNV